MSATKDLLYVFPYPQVAHYAIVQAVSVAF